ncbi:DUF5655 domain-containing protein [Asticcacaulis sp.]|uniref:DUF5655 domain-containing protein n=1 Tax=Asticcacaulis sp. TaxID=1872648 RepID=UPI002BB63D1E|nr:DUF4287 domain-containing protein [Asticcacaulis sp.]HTM83128.1 DUF4287 domain-containing protein [Asticcacaulis sp.]
MINLTPKQEAYFTALTASLERDTGKTLAAWIEIVRVECPESTRHTRAAWLKTHHGLSQTRIQQILNEFLPPGAGWTNPDVLRAALWKTPAFLALLTAFESLTTRLPDVVPTQRKGYSAFSRDYQFAALKPVKGGVRIGLAVPPQSDPRLFPAYNERWSERLYSSLTVASPAAVSDLYPLVERAYENS